jgi:hypothetical protein
MAWPQTAIVTDEPVTTVALNSLPVMIANTTLSGDAASIDFAVIGGHYSSLMLVCYLRGSTAATSVQTILRFNGDGGANYDTQYLLGLAAAASAGEAFAAGFAQVGNMPGSSAGANLFSTLTVVVPHYANAANNKACQSQWAMKFGTTTADIESGRFAGFWRSSTAITQVQIAPNTGNIVSGSRVTLYGLP